VTAPPQAAQTKSHDVSAAATTRSDPNRRGCRVVGGRRGDAVVVELGHLAVTSGTAEAREAPLRLVQPPLVVYHPDSRNLDAWVRLNRPLKHNIGHPGEYAGKRASLEVAGTNDDFVFGLERTELHLRPTCYREDLFLDREQPELVDGQPLEVTLRLDRDHRLTGTATVKVRESVSDPQGELGCPASRRSQRCRGDAYGEYLISLVSAAGISCARPSGTSSAGAASRRCAASRPSNP
jgi:hypothetical protein